MSRDQLRPHGWPELGAAALYGLPGEVVRAIEPHTEADPAALLVDFLTSFGSAVGAGPSALADGALHPARLFAVLVGETARSRKGTARRQIQRLLERVDERWARDCVAGGLSSGEGLIAAVADPEEGPPADHRLLVVEEEFARVLAVGGREGNTLSPTIRQAWDTGNLRVMTRKEPLSARGAHISIIAHTTMEELRRKLNEVEIANGFANRYLIVAVRRSQLLPHGGEVAELDMARLVKQCNGVLGQARRISRLRWSPRAAELWESVYADLARQGAGGLVEALTARAEAQVLRLSVAYALTDGSPEMQVPHLEAARALWAYCYESARLVFEGMTGDQTADRIFQAVQDRGELDLESIRDLFSRHLSASARDSAVELLKRMGRVVVDVTETAGRPRTVLRPKR